MKLLLAALAMTAPMTLPAPAISAPVTVAASDLDKLVLILMPDRQMLDLVIASARTDAKRNPEFARDPAMLEFVFGRMRPEIDKMVRSALPELRADIAKVIAAELSPEEIADIYTFFASPTGQKLQRISFEAIAENPTGDAQAQQQVAVERFMASVTPEDYPALTAFGASSGARKMQTVTPKVSAASAAWAERLLAREGSRITTLRTQAIADYKRQKGGAK